jgi:voltage-gated potassium channel
MEAGNEPAQPKAAGAGGDVPSTPVAPHPAGRPARIGIYRYSAAEFLIALVLFIVVTPLVDALPKGHFIDGTLLTLVLVSGMLAVGGRRGTLVIAAILVTPAVLARWIHHFQPASVPVVYFLVPALVVVVFLVIQLLWFILRAPWVNSEVLCAGVSTYLLLGLAWSFAYMLLAFYQPHTDHDPGAFAFSVASDSATGMIGFTSAYFSFITLSTVGYGDITPVSNAARMLAMMEAVTGTLFVAVTISRLVALYGSSGASDGADTPGQSHARPRTQSDPPSTTRLNP